MRKLVVGLAALALAVPAVGTRTGGRDAPLGAPAAALEGADPRDAALGDELALLALLPDGVAGGRFEFVAHRARELRTAARWRGEFWRTARGNVYTRAAPYDAELVRRELSPLLDRLRQRRAEFTATPDPRGQLDVDEYAPLLRGEYPDTAEFQLRLADVVAPLLRPVGLGSVVFDPAQACGRLVEEHRTAVRRAVGALRPAFRPAGGRERWRIDVRALRRATSATRNRAERECTKDSRDGGISADGPGAVFLVVERSARGLELRLEQPRRPLYVPRRLVTVRVDPAPVGPPPERPRPHFGADGDEWLIDVAGWGGRDELRYWSSTLVEFLLAVSACRGLPWEYIHIAGSGTYFPPASRYYLGPTAYTTDWVCARDVPPDVRADAEELAGAGD